MHKFVVYNRLFISYDSIAVTLFEISSYFIAWMIAVLHPSKIPDNCEITDCCHQITFLPATFSYLGKLSISKLEIVSCKIHIKRVHL